MTTQSAVEGGRWRVFLTMLSLLALGAASAGAQGAGLSSSSYSGISTSTAITAAMLTNSNGTVNFSFDQVDVRALVKLMSDLTGRSFMVDEAVKARITVVAPGVPVSELYPLFVGVLESAGCGLIDQGQVARVVLLPPRGMPPAPLVSGNAVFTGTGIVTRLVRLQNRNALEIKKALDGVMGRDKVSAIAAVESSNHLVITDTVGNIRRMEALIAQLDQPGLGVGTEVVALRYLDATEVAQQFNDIYSRREKVTQAASGQTPNNASPNNLSFCLVAVPYANSVVAIGAPADISDFKSTVAKIDVMSPSGLGNLHTVFLNYLSSDEAARALNNLFGNTSTAPGSGRTAPQQIVYSGGSRPADPRRRIWIEPSAANNALLVDASPIDFERIRDLIAQLDSMPEQVLIEVLIAETSWADGSEFGMQIAAVKVPSQNGKMALQGAVTEPDAGSATLLNSLQNNLFPNGISFGLGYRSGTDNNGNPIMSYPAALNLNAVKSKSDFKVLSNVPLLTQNNKEASVSVVNNIPILKSTISAGAGTARDVIQNIERMDVGIKLKMTPRINPNHDVTLILNPIIEAVTQTTGSGPDANFTPTIARREVSTTVTVPDGRTIVISGLIREDRRSSIARVPILGSIPLLGWFFRHTKDSVERTNLIIFVTPRVVTATAAADKATENLGRRTGMPAASVVMGVGTNDLPRP